MKWLHNLLKGASLTGALFVFQACYGTPQVPQLEEEEEVASTSSLEVSGEDAEGDIDLPAE